MLKYFKKNKKRKIISFDVGFDIIKAIYINDENSLLTGRAIHKRYSKKKNVVDKSKKYFENFYRYHQDEIINTILEIIDEFKIDNSQIEVLISFNSLYTDVFSRQINALNMKRLKYSGELITEKMKKENYIADFKILNFDKKEGKGEILFFSYNKHEFANFKEIISKMSLNVTLMQFDVLSLANLVNYTNLESVVLEIGLSKTMLIQIKKGILQKTKILPFGSYEIFNRIRNRLNLELDEIIELNSKDILQEFFDLAKVDLDTFYESFLSRLKKEIKKNFGEKIPPIILSGGILYWDDFRRYFEEYFGHKTRVLRELDFFDNIEYNRKDGINYNIALGQLLEFL